MGLCFKYVPCFWRFRDASDDAVRMACNVAAKIEKALIVKALLHRTADGSEVCDYICLFLLPTPEEPGGYDRGSVQLPPSGNVSHR